MEDGYPKQHAASMLLSKDYMAKATNTDIQTMGGTMDYWGLAYNEAMKVYNSGEYSLVADLEVYLQFKVKIQRVYI